jgi:organic hydroperoxide reductase OsmC/OhrA
MLSHTATIRWFASPGEDFAKGQYSRAHSWMFDGGTIVPASASPSVVRPPWAEAAAVDPEEALIASVSSCHMLWFLDLARHAGHSVISYEDEADGALEKCDDGKVRITRIMLRPQIAFAEPEPDAAAIDALHHEAHERCLIANSITATVTVEPR